MFSERLKSLRKAKNLSQYELADRLGFSRGKLANYEQGTREPDFATLEIIADFFDVSTDYLLGKSNVLNISTSKADQDEAEFQAFANNPSLQKWYKELPKSKEEDLERLRMMWEILKKDSN